MMRKQIKATVTATLAALLCLLAILPASAMSPIEPEVGVDVFGVFPQGRKSELRLDSLALTYDVSELPAEEYADMESLQAYSPTLRLDYTFSNPTDTEQAVKMMFAAGNAPSYAQGLCTSAQLASFYSRREPNSYALRREFFASFAKSRLARCVSCFDSL
ncbi:MAG: hypothetical protein IJW70_10470 [Clostridia bacterium]|nr:hypothetical protein [Clostridia bacterium]